MGEKKEEAPIDEVVFDHLKGSGLKPETAHSFRKLYAHLERDEPISKYLLDKFTRAGIYEPTLKKVRYPEDGMGLILQAMTFEGLLECKVNGKKYSTK